MNTPPESRRLADVIGLYGPAYLLTVSGKGAPHAVPVAAALEGGEVVVENVGQRTREYAGERPVVALIWPPASEEGYTLIVDGEAGVNGDAVRIAVTRAVLHRSRPSPTPENPGNCDSDCVELGFTP